MGRQNWIQALLLLRNILVLPIRLSFYCDGAFCLTLVDGFCF
jgi:hypothetical protein